MIYNINFHIAALVFLLIILFHFMEQKTLDLANNRTFLWFMIVGFVNILFDLLCTVLITLARPELAFAMELCLIILYTLQALVSHALLVHLQSQFRTSATTLRRQRLLTHVPMAAIAILILWNHWSGIFFTVHADGTYTRGPYYLLMYAFAGAYLIAALIVSIAHSRQLGRRKVRAVVELVCFTGGTVVIQSIFNDLLITGFGITLGITVLFFTLNNPYHYTDSLTGAFDIRYFRDRSASRMEHRKKFHLLAVELSQIKRINLIMGTGVGNRLLGITAQMLRSSDKRNLVFRTTGKRFLVITPSISQYEALQTQVQEFFSQPVDLDGELISSPAILCGIIDAEKLGGSDTLLAYVEYLISLAGRSTETCFIQGDSETLKGFRYNQEIESFLDTAMERDLFEVAYQPVYSLERGGYITLEVLSRLRHPTLGPVAPDVFISLAEKNDQISRIGLLQLRRVCAFIKEHPELMTGIQNVKINLSPAELMKTGHAERLIRTIREFGLPPSYFQFEITETVATEYSESLNQTAAKFTAAGIGLCLDDFGSGFANLNTVLKLPFSAIKLDRSLLTDICQDDRAASFYQSIVAALRNMGYTVISEGVETSGELELVSSWGVDMIQGYCFSRPVPGEEILSIVRSA